MHQMLAIGFAVACCLAVVSCQMPGAAMSMGGSSTGGMASYMQRVASSPQAGGAQLAGMSSGMPSGLFGGASRSPGMGISGMALMMGGGGIEMQDILAFRMCTGMAMPSLICLRYLN